ncbi:MAG: hypothetical protein IPK82_15310 [Polyangiaceae bacterium]|nr:hypothetical protein [Polyangiaceae bacterium]
MGSAAAHAQSLPKGYASDETQSAPPAASTQAPATPAPAMKQAVTEESGVSATAQISTSTDDYADTDPSALTDFQEPLQSYGTWVVDPTYGTVWVPDSNIVGADFAPYQTGGYWSLTDDGEWLWVSTYDWGYIPFHYGRWIWISGRGWSWIPGRVYAPAWVTWRVSDYGYIGWAPLPPSWYWAGTSAVYFSTYPSAAYVFCPTSYVFHTHVHKYVVHDKDTVKSIAAHSRNYKPATPTASATGSQKSGESGAKVKAGGAADVRATATNATAVKKPVGPSMKEAGVPDSAVPGKRSAPDQRAQLFSKKSTTAKAKALVKTQRAALATTAGSRPVSRAGSFATGSAKASPAARGSATSPVYTSTPTPSRGHVLRTPGSSAGARGTAPASRGTTAVPTQASRSSTTVRPASTPTRVHTPSATPSRSSAPRATAPRATSTPRVSTPSGGSRSSGSSGARSSAPRGGRR